MGVSGFHYKNAYDLDFKVSQMAKRQRLLAEQHEESGTEEDEGARERKLLMDNL